jgi:hypothetical protein
MPRFQTSEQTPSDSDGQWQQCFLLRGGVSSTCCSPGCCDCSSVLLLLLLCCLCPLQTGNPEVVADLYAPDGVLLPTVSNQVRAIHSHCGSSVSGQCQESTAYKAAPERTCSAAGS